MMKVWFGRTEAVILTDSVEDDISYGNLGKISTDGINGPKVLG